MHFDVTDGGTVVQKSNRTLFNVASLKTVMHIFAKRRVREESARHRPRGAEITTANIDFRLLLFYSLSLTPRSLQITPLETKRKF